MRGATVGGSGAINGGYFCRGLPYDFDRAAITGWVCSDVRDCFRTIEMGLDFDGPAHDNAGYLPVQRTREMAGTIEIFLKATQRVDCWCIVNLNDVGLHMLSGIEAISFNIIDGVRASFGAIISNIRAETI